MLSASYLDTLPDEIIALYTEYEESVILDIARRLGNLDFESAAWQMQRVTESGLVYENALRRLAVLTGQSEFELRQLFERAGVRAMHFDDDIYRAAGFNPVPLNLSPAMMQVLSAGFRRTHGIMTNLVQTTAINAQQGFLRAADLAYMQVSSGAMSYTQAIRAAVQNAAASGLTVGYPTGHMDQLDVAVRRSVLTGVSQTTGELQIARANELGQDLVQTSAHAGARPTHQVWQGRIFSRSGKSSRYPDFVESTGYGTGPGLMGWNCRHSFFPFFEGISQNAYDEEMVNELNDASVMFHGKPMDMYDATQYQRSIERKIRYWKREAGALEAAGQDNSGALNHLGTWQARMRDFVNQTGLPRQRDREQVLGLGHLRGTVQKATEITREGAPVSAALKITQSTYAQPLQEVMEIIDQIHGDGRLPRIPYRVDNDNHYLGKFLSTRSGIPDSIYVSRWNNPAMRLSAAHEIGHFLDLAGIGVERQFASINDPLLDAWREALMNSRAYRQWLEIRRSHYFTDRRGRLIAVSDNAIEYWTDIHEFWARSYAQYIIENSQNDDMLNELRRLRERAFLPVQWEEDDFAPIRNAIEDLFKALGWKK
jgi:hypothetical protein